MPTRSRTSAPLWAGVIGPVLFVVTFLVEGAMRPGYDAMRLQVSFLSLGERGFVQVASFLVSGVLILAFAVGLRRDLEPGVGARAGPIGVALVGVGMLIAGVFSTMPAFGYPPGTPDGFPSDIPPTGYLHVLGALCFFFGMIVAALGLARRFAREGSRGWAALSIAAAIIVLVFFGASSADPTGQPYVPAAAGLLQRISIITGLGWLALLAGWRLRLARVVGSRT